MKYCNSCGAQIPDDAAAFCPICGASQNAQAIPPMQNAVPPMQQAVPPVGYEAYNTGYADPYAAPKKSKKGLFIALGSALAALILIIIIVIVVLSTRRGASTQKELVDDFIKSLNKQDSKAFMNLLPECYENQMKQEYSGRDIFSDFPYKGYKITLGETRNLDIFDKEDIIDAENDVYRQTNDRVVIEEGCRVKYEIDLTYEAYNYTDTDTISFTCVKIDGRWYIIDLDM